MSVIAEIVDALEKKTKLLLIKLDKTKKENQDLTQKLKESKEIAQKQLEKIEALNKQIETLKFANSLLGSNDNKKETKLKINSLIREIDYCIAQLSD